MASPDSEEKPRTLTSAGRVAVVSLLILLAGAGIMGAAMQFGKKAVEAPAKRPVPDVELVTAAAEDVPVTLESQGIVQAVTETRAAAEVPGRIVRVSPSWDAGGTFKENEELLQIDDADYKAALANAEAAASEAQLAVLMEEERGKQALRDWNKLGTGKPESELVTRGPQLVAAKARHAAAAAAVERARRDLERTVLRAPYAGRIRATLTDLGSYAAPASPLAEFYSTDAYQVSLPLSVDDYHLLDSSTSAVVHLSAASGEEDYRFTATIARTAAEIDRASRTIHVVAEIKPGKNPPPLLVPGLFVKAALPGIILHDVVSLPRVCLLPNNRVALAGDDNKLRFRTVKVARSTRDSVLISEGVQPGERVLATALAVITEGMDVNPVPSLPAATATPVPPPPPPSPPSAPAGAPQ
jgi:RND family efflux transporter MFP subunit